jgi:hypothetical protein
MSTNNRLRNRFLVLVVAVATGVTIIYQAAHNITAYFVEQSPDTLMIADKDPPTDPGKDITDDPHGPDPHGGSPYSEIHDPKLPANQTDVYGHKK